MDKITSVRGFKDILPGDTEKWHFVEEKAREIFTNFGVREIKIPILEKTDLFKRGIGEATDSNNTRMGFGQQPVNVSLRSICLR